MSVVTRDFTPTVYLKDEGGNLLRADQAGGGYDASGNVQSYLRAQLPAGNYQVQVFSDVASGGNYLFKYTYNAGNPQACATSPLTPGDAALGTISAAACRTGMGLTDLYAVTLPAPGTLELDMSSLDFETVLTIRDQKDNLIVRNNGVDGVTASHLGADLPLLRRQQPDAHASDSADQPSGRKPGRGRDLQPLPRSRRIPAGGPRRDRERARSR